MSLCVLECTLIIFHICSPMVSRDLRYDLYMEHYCRDFSDLFGTTEDTRPLKAGQLNVLTLFYCRIPMSQNGTRKNVASTVVSLAKSTFFVIIIFSSNLFNNLNFLCISPNLMFITCNNTINIMWLKCITGFVQILENLENTGIW